MDKINIDDPAVIRPLMLAILDKHVMAFMVRLVRFEVSLRQFCLMNRLYRGAQMKMGEIGKFWDISTAAVTDHIDRLEKLQLVERTRGTDRRSVYVSLTPPGRAWMADRMTELDNLIAGKS